MSRYVTGTIAQLAGKLTLNGKVLDQPALSTMTRFLEGAQFKQVGVIKKDGERGRPAIIWQVDTGAAAWFETSANLADLVVSDTDAPAYVAPVKTAATA